MAERIYIIENIARDARTRLHRAMASATQRGKLFIAGQRLVPMRKIPLNEDAFQREGARLKQMVLDGMVVIYTPEGLKITSAPTGEFILTRADGATKMLARGEEPECFGAAVAAAPVPKPAPLPPPPAPEPVYAPEPVSEPEPEPEPLSHVPTEVPEEEDKPRKGSSKKRR